MSTLTGADVVPAVTLVTTWSPFSNEPVATVIDEPTAAGVLGVIVSSVIAVSVPDVP